MIRSSRWAMPFGAALAALAVVAIAFAAAAGPVEQWRLAARWTARIGFPLLIATYVASSLYRLWPREWSRALLRERRWLGLSFAATHTVHLAALIAFFRASGTRPETVTVIGGGFAYVLLYAMALTSNQASMRALGRNWKRLHTVGIHWLWFVFASSYAGRIFDPGRAAIGWAFAPIAFAALALRMWARFGVSRAATPPAERRTA